MYHRFPGGVDCTKARPVAPTVRSLRAPLFQGIPADSPFLQPVASHIRMCNLLFQQRLSDRLFLVSPHSRSPVSHGHVVALSALGGYLWQRFQHLSWFFFRTRPFSGPPDTHPFFVSSRLAVRRSQPGLSNSQDPDRPGR